MNIREITQQLGDDLVGWPQAFRRMVCHTKPSALPLALAALLCSCAPQAQPPTTAADKPPIPCTPRAASKAGRLATQGLGYGMAASALDLAIFTACEAVARTASPTKEKR